MPPFFHTAETAIDNRCFNALGRQQKKRLQGRFGIRLPDVLSYTTDEDFLRVGNTDFLWLELRWAARQEQVQHLDDLLLRRTRVGNLLENGAEQFMDRIGSIMRLDGGWSESCWQDELARYRQLWKRSYSLGETL